MKNKLEMFKVKKTKAFVSSRGERYPSGYAVVNKYGTIFHIAKTKTEAGKIAKKGNQKVVNK